MILPQHGSLLIKSCVLWLFPQLCLVVCSCFPVFHFQTGLSRLIPDVPVCVCVSSNVTLNRRHDLVAGMLSHYHDTAQLLMGVLQTHSITLKYISWNGNCHLKSTWLTDAQETKAWTKLNCRLCAS